MENMYDSELYMNMQMLAETLSEFDWPEPYQLEDDLPDGIIVAFPKSNFCFTEGPDGDIRVGFLATDTKCESALQLGHALSVLRPQQETGPTPNRGPISEGMIEWPFPSEEKARNGIRNACGLILTHLQDVIAGDFSWVRQYLESRRT